MLLKTIIHQGIQALSDIYPEDEARQMVLACLEDMAGIKRHTHILEPDYELSDEMSATVSDAFRRMALGEPLQYVTGKAFFYGRTFSVDPSVLIPRPETELLCRMAVQNAGPNARILDLCTGSGCIAWTLALELPGSRVTAIDISSEALSVASSQDFSDEIALLNANAPSFVRADVLQNSLEGVEGRYDVIVSNPPYVMDSEKALMRSNVLEHEPHLALFVPDADPLMFYRPVAFHARRLLSDGGMGIVEINEALGRQTAEAFLDAGFSETKVVKDLNGRDRFVVFR